MPAWVEELSSKDSGGGGLSEAEEHGIQHFTIQVPGRPFHAKRWFDVLHGEGNPELFAGVLRSKDCFWTREEPDTRVDYPHVGHISDLVVNQLWAQVGLGLLGSWAKLKGGPSADDSISIERGIQRPAFRERSRAPETS
jgi:G3E family GTPase